MPIETKVAIITGASQGIGAGLVAALLQRGYRVVANSRKIDSAAASDRCVIVAGDISDRNTAQSIVSTALDRFGRIDLLVNNAGSFIAKPFGDYTADEFQTLIGTNLAGFFHVSQLTAAQMLKQGSGHIVNISTAFAEQPVMSVPASLAILTKGGLNAITHALAIEYAARGIRVNAVSPGIIDTPMHPKENHPFLRGLHPVGRIGEIKDIVEGVLYLEDAAFVTGEILHIDGGATAGRW